MLNPFEASIAGALVSGRAQPGVVLLRPETVDFGASCAEAEALGAVAVIFAAERGAERPFGYRHDRAPPGGTTCHKGTAKGENLEKFTY